MSALKTKVVRLTDLPGCSMLDKNIELMAFEPNPHALKPKKHFVMDTQLFEESADQIGQRLLGITDDGLHYSGPVGCGKSTTVRQILAYLNYPTQVEVGHEDLEYDALCGRLDPVAGVMGFVDGPLKTAYEKGQAFLFEEREKAPARTNVALNTILDGAPMHVSQIGRGHRINKEHGFLFISTGNAAGGVDLHGNHPTAHQQDTSTEDRFDIIQVDYCSHGVEAKMINTFNAPDGMVDNIVEAANICRSVHVSTTREKHADAPDIQFTLPITYRGTQRILRNLMYKRPRFSNTNELIDNVLQSSLNLKSIMPEEETAIIEVFKSQLMKKGGL
ncbi:MULTISPECIES: AAA family ATPase [Vibrio]|uniref:ATPase dynein-related AAA domain-containing protein n=2 Tax=Vibrio TaxID=662 RepID=A0A510IJ90_9VIBR|nr:MULTISPECIES: AAA family ATPase [Vibrio]RTZ24604.1 hypothetical protein EKN09_02800 [Vibrio penaeicida]BBL92280.1 hypothetical protein VroAM7_49330 [Vibrio rotiferianus]GLQ71105.1 hypothetical protein GCM10007932_04650 [Vibrio penaeicida]